MRYAIRSDSPVPKNVDKSILFTSIYRQLDNALPALETLGPISFDRWGRLRLLIGEYVGNLFKHPTGATFVDINIEYQSSPITLELYHDGKEYDQFEEVESIKNAARILNIQAEEFYGTGTYTGFRCEIPFEKSE